MYWFLWTLANRKVSKTTFWHHWKWGDSNFFSRKFLCALCGKPNSRFLHFWFTFRDQRFFLFTDIVYQASAEDTDNKICSHDTSEIQLPPFRMLNVPNIHIQFCSNNRQLAQTKLYSSNWIAISIDRSQLHQKQIDQFENVYYLLKWVFQRADEAERCCYLEFSGITIMLPFRSFK